jgi:CBS domain-containing protein
MRIGQLMTTNVISVAPDTPLKEVAHLLVTHGISGVPVCDPDGVVLGVVSEADILRKEQGIDTDLPPLLSWVVGRLDGELAKVTARTAGEAMTAPAIIARPTQQVAEVARLMIDRSINRVPVAADGKLVGIVSRADLVRAFARSDEEIEREIREDAIFRTLLLLPEQLGVTVRDGRVGICGYVEREPDAHALVQHVQRVPGVLHVDSDLQWRSEPRPERARALPL